MKNFRSVSKAGLLLFLSGFCLAVPTLLDASNLKDYDGAVTESSCLKGKGACHEKVGTTGILSKVSTTFSELRNSRLSGEKCFVDREGSVIRFERTTCGSQDSSFQSRVQASQSQHGVPKSTKEPSGMKEAKLSGHEGDVFALKRVATRSGMKNNSRHVVGARFTVTNEFSDSSGGTVNMSEFGALLPLLSKGDNLVYIDLKSKLYDAKEGEVSTGVVFRRKVSPLLTAGINLFTDVRFLPEGRYRWYSLGGEIFFRSFSLNGNYYRSDKKTNISSVKTLEYHHPDPKKATIVLHERSPGNGYDLGLGLNLNKYIYVRGSAFFFNSPHNVEEKFSGYRAGVDLSFYLNERFSVLISPEFVTDTKKNRFLLNVGFDLPVGRDYSRLLEHVRRDRDIVLFDTDNSYDVNAVFLVADKEYKINKLTRVSPRDQKLIKKLGTKTEDSPASTRMKNKESEAGLEVVLVRDNGKDGEINLTGGSKELIFSDETALKVHVPYLGGERIVNYSIPKSRVTIKLAGDNASAAKFESLLFNGARIDLDDPTKYTMKDVTFNSCFLRSAKENLFQNDKNVTLVDSKLEALHSKPKFAFYSTKSETKNGKPVVSYTLKNAHIELPNVEYDPRNPAKGDFKALFASDLDKMGKIDVKLAGEIKIDTKTSIDARKKVEEEIKAVTSGTQSAKPASAPQ